MKGRIWLGPEGFEELLSPVERRLTIEDFEITREDRTASGRLVIDVIAVKKRFTLAYAKAENEVLEQLKRLYEQGGIQSLKIENKDGTIDAYKVKFRPFSRMRYYISTNVWLWSNINVQLEEI